MRFFLITVLAISGCSKIDSNKQIKNQADSVNTIFIDSCEYLTVENSVQFANNYSFAITHKGNCSNPIHRCPDEGKKAK